MSAVTCRQFRILADHMAVYQFMTEIYEQDWRNGVPAPFFEYALSSDWMDKRYIHRCRIWEDGEKIVAFCFMENPVTDIYFSLRPGYELLADEMIAYAQASMPGAGKPEQQLVLFEGQEALMKAAERAGWHVCSGYDDRGVELANIRDYALPEGYRFATAPLDVAKCVRCCWKGFDHEAEEGPWNGDTEHAYMLLAAPHATDELDVAVEDETGEYVCYAGMWWTPENRLAYMEPLCTVPEHRGKGLAAAALSHLGRRMKAMGATHMTGGGSEFYRKIGFETTHRWTRWKKAVE